MARHFQDIHFDIVGINASPDTLAFKNVKYHGFLQGEELASVSYKADIGICPLAPHRVGMKQLTSLKLRNYLAVGLPSIIAHQDRDFPNGAPFLLKIPNEEDGVAKSLDQIDRLFKNGKVPAWSESKFFI